MISIINGRDSGKTKQLLDLARRKNAIIITGNKRAFIVKAKSLGYEDVEVIDYSDLERDNYSLAKPLLIHNIETAIKYLFSWYDLDIMGYSANVNFANLEPKKKNTEKEQGKKNGQKQK